MRTNMIPIAGFFTTRIIQNDEVFPIGCSYTDNSDRFFECTAAPDCIRKDYYNDQSIFSDLKVKEFKEEPNPEDFLLYI